MCNTRITCESFATRTVILWQHQCCAIVTGGGCRRDTNAGGGAGGSGGLASCSNCTSKFSRRSLAIADCDMTFRKLLTPTISTGSLKEKLPRRSNGCSLLFEGAQRLRLRDGWTTQNCIIYIQYVVVTQRHFVYGVSKHEKFVIFIVKGTKEYLM